MSDAEVIAASPEQVAELLARLDRLEAEVAQLREENAALRKRVAELEAELEVERGRNGPKTPQNSSLPPAVQHPHARPERKRKRSGRKPGGQPGHPKHERPPLPSDFCDEVVEVRPQACRSCGGPLEGDDHAPYVHQVWDVPEIIPEVVEYRLHRLQCECGQITRAPLPAGVPQGQSGPRLVALCAHMTSNLHVSRRRTALFVQEVCNIPCSDGLVVKMQDIAAAAVEPAYAELAAALPKQDSLNLDESPTKEGPNRSWLWAFVSTYFALYVLAPTRKGIVAASLLGPGYSGTVHCDRARMYLQFSSLQWCWAHLMRDFQSLVDAGNGVQKRLGWDVLREAREMFRLVQRVRDGTLEREMFRELMKPIRRKIEEYLLRGVFSGDRRLRGLCMSLHAGRENLWRFVDEEGVEPTNNAAERALRPAVIWRKISHGSKSASGSRFIERMLTVIETCRLQGRSAYAYLTDAVTARFAGRACPSLTPGV
jgi:transposase